MSIQPIGGSDAATPRTQSMADLVPLRVAAPRHPLADPQGQVPIEVFEVPPELVDVVRTLPIRSPSVATEPAPETPRLVVAQERRGTRIDVEA